MPLQETSGAASYDAYGGGVAVVPTYIEDVFSTWLYSGTGAGSSNLPQTISNGIDLSTKGGLVWIKARNTAGDNNYLFDTSRTAGYRIESNLTDAQAYNSDTLTSFNNNGFTLGTDGTIGGVNYSSSRNYASWTFRKQPKFFDVVTYTGDGVDARRIAHNLGSVPGAIFVKNTSGASNWIAYHKDVGTNFGSLLLNSTAAQSLANVNPSLGATYSGYVDTANDTTFRVRLVDQNSGSAVTGQNVNQTGQTYVAYLFAHNAGGFGLTGTDNVISCGSYAGTGSLQTINLGYEAQWVLIKRTDSANSWYLFDNMRGLSMTQCLALLPNGANSELDYGTQVGPSSIGFTVNNNAAFNASGGTYIYIAIRRGPMKVPTDATKVYDTAVGTANVGFITSLPYADFQFDHTVSGTSNWDAGCRLAGNRAMWFNLTDAEVASSLSWDRQNGLSWNSAAASSYRSWQLRRAPGFFDVVCYTGTGASLSHNLGVTPELIIAKARGTTGSWRVTSSATTGVLYLDATDAKNGTDSFQTLTPCTATTMNLSGISQNTTNVAYLFASCPGVSKVGSYTGNGTTQTINCGFTGGARFVLIKRTDSTGGWYVYDTARGMTTLTDPYLLLNSTAAESATLGSVTTVTTGFAVNAAVLSAINASGGSYIFFAVA